MNVEREIIESIQRGERERFGELYDLYAKKIYRFIYWKTLHKESAEDLTSRVFLKALQNIDRVRMDGNFSAWLYEIARNTVIDHFRKEKRSIPIEDIWEWPDDERIERDAESQLAFREVRKHFESLTPQQREIVILRIWEEMAYREIAEVMKKSEDNCKVIFSRAIAKLRSANGVMAFLLLLSFMQP